MKKPLFLLTSLLSFSYSEIAIAYSDTVLKAIRRALDDECKAYTTYQAVIQKLGDQKPFKNIVKSEYEHIQGLQSLLRDANLDIPENPYKISDISVPETLSEACAQGVLGEIDNAKLYEKELIPAVKGNPAIEKIFRALSVASKNRHLKAFQRCAKRGSSAGPYKKSF